MVFIFRPSANQTKLRSDEFGPLVNFDHRGRELAQTVTYTCILYLAAFYTGSIMKALSMMRFTRFISGDSHENAYFVTFGIHGLSVICDSFILLGIMIAVSLPFAIALIKQLLNNMFQLRISWE